MAATYDELQSEVANWLVRADLSAFIPSFIRSFEDQVNFGFDDGDVMRLREMDATSTLSGTSGVFPLPANFREARAVIDDTTGGALQYITPDAAADRYAGIVGGAAQSYTIAGTSLKTYPASASTVTLDYFSSLPNLSGAVPSNWLLAKAPTFYLYGSLVHAFAYARNLGQAQFYRAATLGLREGLKTADRRGRHSRAGVSVRGPTP